MTGINRNIILFVLLLTLTAGCEFQDTESKISLAENLLRNGELTEAARVAGEILKSKDLSPKMEAKTDSILEICYRIKRDFTLSGSDVIQALSKYNPKADSIELLRLEKEHKIDLLVLDGKKSYFRNCIRNVFLLDTVYAGLKKQKEGCMTDSLSLFRIAHSKEILKYSGSAGKPVNPVRLKLTYTIRVAADAIPAGETIRCWMPFPREQHRRQQDIHLSGTEPASFQLSPLTDLQRSLYMEKIAVANQPTIFRSEIEYTSYAQTFQLNPEMIRPYQKENPLYREFTAEKPPQIVFNDNIKSLAKSILGDETNPLLQVRKIYRWINDSVTWASALEYSIIPDIPGFVMKYRHGDCGMQTLLFMTLARHAGIPVKWQSGWMLHPGETNLHDWCEVWYEGYGWVPLDQSFGL
ncbi:MAG TPA: transglutaminase domain-containing protein, partial [Prolixibacteraceae bacterium]|nr:transglutaminase domain-containing protein [Prolixibacteraceae bacterium]